MILVKNYITILFCEHVAVNDVKMLDFILKLFFFFRFFFWVVFLLSCFWLFYSFLFCLWYFCSFFLSFVIISWLTFWSCLRFILVRGFNWIGLFDRRFFLTIFFLLFTLKQKKTSESFSSLILTVNFIKPGYLKSSMLEAFLRIIFFNWTECQEKP